VNSYANHAIRYVEDRELWGKSDFWANAKTTFRLGKGDCEDIAIAKLQMLAAMGIRREDMVLTLTRDLVRQVDHAVLIVRLDGQYVMLDNTTDKLVDASASQGYRPILSFGKDQTWIHGY
jgi:predicted transglutaminase-like cysteine proteinase